MPRIVDINAETGEVFITEIPDPETEIIDGQVNQEVQEPQI
jgi:hypothetical protein